MSQQNHQNGKSEGKSVEKIKGMGQDAGKPSHGFAWALADEADVPEEARHCGGDDRTQQQYDVKNNLPFFGLGRGLDCEFRGFRRFLKWGRGIPAQNRLLAESNFLTWLKPDGFSRRNGDFGPCPWVSADTTLARLHKKDAEASKLNALASLHGLFESSEKRVHSDFSFDFGDANSACDATDNILFDHSFFIPL